MKNCPGARPSRLRRMLALATATLTGAAGLGLAAGVATITPASAATTKQLVISGEAASGNNPWSWGDPTGAYATLKNILGTRAWTGGGYTVDADGIADITAAGALDGVDVFFAALPPSEYGPTESAVLQAFVQRGGHLVLNANKDGFGGLPQFLSNEGFSLRDSAFFGAPCGYAGNAAPNGTAVAAGLTGALATMTTGAAGLNLFHTVTALDGIPAGATRLVNYTNTAQPVAPRIIQPSVTNVSQTGVNVIARVQNSANATTAQLLIDSVAVGAPVAVNQGTGVVTLPTGAVTPGTRSVVVRVTQAVTLATFDSPAVSLTFGATSDPAAPDLDACNGLDSPSNNDFLVASGPHTVAAIVPAGAATFGGTNTGAVIVTTDLDIFSNQYGGLTGANETFAINTFQYLLNTTLGVDYAPATALRPGVSTAFTTTLTANSGNLSYNWTFPTGTPSTSTAASPSVSFPSEGTVSLTLTVVDNTTGARGTTVKTFDVGTSSFVPLPNPVRIYNTRSEGGLIGPNSIRTVPIRGRGNIPAEARSVIMNVTVVDSTTGGYLQVWPTGDARPADTSTHNFRPNETFPNLVVSGIGNDGTVSVYNNAGTVHILVDAVGYTLANSTGSRLTSITPARLFNTRDGDNITRGPLGQGETRSVQVRGIDNVPQNATAVVLNLTADQASTTGSFVTAWPSGQSRPTDTSNLNLIAGVTRPNVAVVAIGAGGRIDIYNEFGTTELFAEVVGYFSPASLGGITGVNPERVFNTRSGIGTTATPMGPGESRSVLVRGVAGVPSDARTAILKVTVDASSAGGYLSVGPNAFSGEPTFSNLNFQPGMTVPNLVITQIGSDGRVRVYNNAGTVTVLVDILGYAD
jgi:hypothetical protein